MKPRKVVAAGWYVGAGLTLLALGLPPQIFVNVILRVTLILLGSLCLGGAAFEWWFRKPDAPAISLFFDAENAPLPLQSKGIAGVFELRPGESACR